MIESKYTIEYVNPDTEKKPGRKSHKPILSFVFSGILLAALLFFLLNLIPEQTSTDSTSKKETISQASSSEKRPSKAPESKPERSQITKILTETTPDSQVGKVLVDEVTKTKKAEAEIAKKNQEIEKSLTLLRQQLTDSQNKNKTLANELDAQIMENMELSTLLEDSLYKINKEDKSYIKELKKLENNTLSKAVVINKKNTQSPSLKSAQVEKQTNQIKVIFTDPKADTEDTALNKEKEIEKENRVDLSTSSQVDAIVSAMKNDSPSKNNMTTINKPTNNSTVKVKVELQNKINDLINDNESSTKINFEKSLNKI